MSIITVKHTDDTVLGSGDGELLLRDDLIVLFAWARAPQLEVGAQYQLICEGAIWLATCETDQLPVRFRLDLLGGTCRSDDTSHTGAVPDRSDELTDELTGELPPVRGGGRARRAGPVTARA